MNKFKTNIKPKSSKAKNAGDSVFQEVNNLLDLLDFQGNIVFVLFLVFLVFIYIFNTRNTEKICDDIRIYEQSNQELRWEYLSKKAANEKLSRIKYINDLVEEEGIDLKIRKQNPIVIK